MKVLAPRGLKGIGNRKASSRSDKFFGGPTGLLRGVKCSLFFRGPGGGRTTLWKLTMLFRPPKTECPLETRNAFFALWKLAMRILTPPFRVPTLLLIAGCSASPSEAKLFVLQANLRPASESLAAFLAPVEKPSQSASCLALPRAVESEGKSSHAVAWLQQASWR